MEVNQRALIDKVLARYSGEFTVFRELLQNSDDAQSRAVEIRFETQAYVDRKAGRSPTQADGNGDGEQQRLPDLKTALVCRGVSQYTYILDLVDRYTNGHSRIMGFSSEMRIGVV